MNWKQIWKDGNEEGWNGNEVGWKWRDEVHDASGKPELRRKDEEKIKKQTGAQRGRGLVGKNAVCPRVLPDRPAEWGFCSLSSHVNRPFSLAAIRHCTEGAWQALYEPPTRIIPPATIAPPAGGWAVVGEWGMGGETVGVAIQTRWKCWKGHLHWGRIIKTTSNLGGRGFGGLFGFHWRPAMVRAEQCSYRKPRTGEQCGMNEMEENETGVHDAGISIEFLWWKDEWDYVFVSSTCVTEDGGGGGDNLAEVIRSC